jgi:putative sterol carrier protein
LIRLVDGQEATLIQESVQEPDILVTMSTEILAGILDKKINVITAYLRGQIQVKGAMADLMKLQNLMM